MKPINISLFVWEINKDFISLKLMKKEWLKIKNIPNKIIMLDKIPVIKNLIRISDELLFTWFNLQRKYIGIICNSIAKYKENKFFEEKIMKIPNIEIKHNTWNSTK